MTEEKKTVTDSEGLKVVTAPEAPPEPKPKKSAARKAYEDELAKDAAEAAKSAEEQEKANAETWQAFISR